MTALSGNCLKVEAESPLRTQRTQFFSLVTRPPVLLPFEILPSHYKRPGCNSENLCPPPTGSCTTLSPALGTSHNANRRNQRTSNSLVDPQYAQSCKDTRLGEIYTSLHWFHLPVKTFHFYAAEPFQMCYGVELQSCVRSLAAFKLREDKSNA